MCEKTICHPIAQEHLDKHEILTVLNKKFQSQYKTDSAQHLDKLKIPTALSKTFPSQNKTDSAPHVCLTKESAIQSIKDIWTN